MDNKLDIIIEGCKNNSNIHQTLLYNKFHNLFISVISKYFIDYATKYDVLHEGFLKIFNNLHKLRTTKEFKSWSCTIIKNLCIDTIRKNKNLDLPTENLEKHIYFDLLSKNNNNVIEQEERENSDNVLNEINSIINNLTPAYKKTFKLYVFGNYKHHEIAEELNICLGASKSNYHKAKKKIQFELKKRNISYT